VGFFDRIRSGLRTIGERLHILKGESPPEQRKEIASLERKIDRMETEIRPVERREEERIPVPSGQPEIGVKRYTVSIRYRPVDSTKATRTRKATVTASSTEEAIAIVEAELDREADFFLSRSAERTYEEESEGTEAPTKGT